MYSKLQAIVNSILYLKDYLDHKHLQSGNPNSILVYGNGRSLDRKMQVRTIYKIYHKYKEEYFPKALEKPSVCHEDKSKIEEQLEKPWNPYVRQALNTWNINLEAAHVSTKITLADHVSSIRTAKLLKK
jgi:hypothetical protein